MGHFSGVVTAVPQVDLGHSKIGVLQVGERGPVLLLVHGFPLDHTMWKFQIDYFQDRARIVAIDLRGFGSSRGGEGGVSMADYADDCAAVLQALEIDEPVCFCGLSMGGYVAWQFWKRHSSKLGQLILCDTRAAADSEEVARGRQRMAFEVLSRGTEFVPDAMLPRLMSPSSFDRFPDRVAQLRQTMLATSANAIAAAQRAMASRIDATHWLPLIKVPALALCGVDDEISRVDEMEDFASRIPNGEFVAIEDAGHMAPLENPDSVNRAIESFLDRHCSLSSL